MNIVYSSEYNIVCKNRDQWSIKSDERDEDYRTAVIGVLLDALCVEFNDYALPFFQILISDQHDIYNPIGN